MRLSGWVENQIITGSRASQARAAIASIRPKVLLAHNQAESMADRPRTSDRT
ncbi:MAG: hypothetical protein BWX47_01281 [candidate division Hyd24-12 bacterium ADurb.Bin004]|nr:MAG: hypothetical protein BWX47_01281 [candidate division Hyd24-12 bacterium ADurb.Bin004]